MRQNQTFHPQRKFIVEIEIDEIHSGVSFSIFGFRLGEQFGIDIPTRDFSFPVQIIIIRKALFTGTATDIQDFIARLKLDQIKHPLIDIPSAKLGNGY